MKRRRTQLTGSTFIDYRPKGMQSNKLRKKWKEEKRMEGKEEGKIGRRKQPDKIVSQPTYRKTCNTS